MQIRVLGSMGAFEGDSALPLGGPKQRLVLALLLVRADQVVPVDRLIDEVWGEQPPATKRGVLQTYVSHLRKALGSYRIEGSGPGYLLRVTSDEVDALRFEALARNGHRLLADDPQAARRELGEALELWHGPPFADLAGEPSLQAEVQRLEELRVLVAEDRIAADLALGHADQLVGELEALTVAYPWRERLWSQLMLALYRSGRQGEALTTFSRARRQLSDELGIDPSPELQRLHAQILRQDPVLILGVRALRGYRLLERVGEGRFGIVWRATQPGTNREVAVKAFHPGVANQPEFIRRFEAEAQAIAAIEHPHVVPTYDYWREPDGAYLVTRFLRGGSLRALLDRSGHPEPDVAAALADQVVQAVAAAHRQRVVHGDLKPANVLLDDEANAYLGDFHIGGQIERSSFGAPGNGVSYLSPERLRGEHATPASDVYALGILLATLWADPPKPIRTIVQTCTTADPRQRYSDATAVLAALRQASVQTVPTVQPPAAAAHAVGQPPRNPYKGLLAFAEADALDFFGREALTAQLVTRLGEVGPQSRFLAVVGPSGSGKSSVVRAGLIPALRAGSLPGSESWFVVQMTPGGHPFEELEAGLLRVAVNPPPSLIEQLQRDEAGLLRAVKRILPEGDAELLLVIDQFEEVFTLVEDEDRRRQFLTALLAAVTDPSSRLRVVITVRADFYDRPLRYQGLAELVRARTEAVVPLAAEELERATAGPAHRVGLAVDPALMARMVADVADQPGGLPLLQYALTELFDRRQDSALTLAVYHQIGGISGALARRADDLYTALSATAREAARQMFLRMVTLGEGVADTRRRVARTELLSLGGDPRDAAAVIDAFGTARLLLFDRDPDTREPTVEVAHESLLREWGRLRNWIEAARHDLRTGRRLATATRDWIDADRETPLLASGSRLEHFAAWREHSGLAITPNEGEFLDASLAERDHRRAKEEARQARERMLERRSFRRLRALVAVFAVAALIAGILTVVALNQTRRLHDQVQVSAARELASAAVANLDVDPELSILLALEAVDATYQVDGTVVREAEETLHRAVQRMRLVRTHPQGGGLAVSTDGARFGTTGQDGTAAVWDTATGERLLTLGGHEGWVFNIAFSSDDLHLATTDESGAVRLWDAASGQLLRTWQGHDGPAVGVEFSPDGQWLATTGADGVARIWDIVSGTVQMALTGHTSWVGGLAFSPDASRVATASADATARIWDLTTGGTVVSLTGHEWQVHQVAFSPDGSRVVTASLDGTACVWDATSGDRLLTLSGHSSWVNSAAFSPDGTRIATAGQDATVAVWDAESGRRLLRLAGHAAEVFNVAFTADGQRLLTGASDGTTRLWDVGPSGGRDWLTVATPNGRFTGVTFAPDGTTFAVPLDDAGVSIRDVEAGSELRRLDGHDATIVRMAFSPDGSRLAAVAGSGATDKPANGTVPVWDVATGELLLVLTGHRDEVGEVAFSPDGSRLVTGSRDATARVWDATSGEQLKILDPGGGGLIYGTAYSPDGQFIVTGQLGAVAGQLGAVVVWDAETFERLRTVDGLEVHAMKFAPDGRLVTTQVYGATILSVESGEVLATLRGHAGSTNLVAISPDGTRVATAGDDGTAKLWDLETGRELLTLYGHDLLVYGVDFSPDGRLLATSSPDGITALHLLPIEEFRELARERLTRDFTDEECRQYLRLAHCLQTDR
jgi:WD40 repeat protein/DNA-binding SARP family transcriptional activator